MADYVNKLKKKQTQKQTNTTPSLCMQINLQIRALTWVSQELQNLTFAFKSWNVFQIKRRSVVIYDAPITRTVFPESSWYCDMGSSTILAAMLVLVL